MGDGYRHQWSRPDHYCCNTKVTNFSVFQRQIILLKQWDFKYTFSNNSLLLSLLSYSEYLKNLYLLFFISSFLQIKESEQSSKTQKNKGQYIPPRRVVHIGTVGAVHSAQTGSPYRYSRGSTLSQYIYVQQGKYIQPCTYRYSKFNQVQLGKYIQPSTYRNNRGSTFNLVHIGTVGAVH